jgi:anti-sigma B factor antagonist
MKIDETKVGATLVLAPTGRLDSVSTPAFEAALQDRIGDAPNAIVLDLAAVPFVSSAGLRVFLSASRRLGEAGSQLVFCGLVDNVREVFAVSGFDSIFAIHADRNAALAALAPSA